MSLPLIETLRALALERPVFHSEADFQFALAWRIREMDPGWHIRLEYPFGERARQALDILLRRDGEEVAIEVKYPTHRLEVVLGGERFRLKEAATDLARYEAVRDIARMESFVGTRERARAFVVVLTNHRALWTPPAQSLECAAFSLHEGRELTGTLAFAPDTRNPSPPLTVHGRYRVKWLDYSEVRPDAGHGRFRFAIFDIRRPRPEP